MRLLRPSKDSPDKPALFRRNSKPPDDARSKPALTLNTNTPRPSPLRASTAHDDPKKAKKSFFTFTKHSHKPKDAPLAESDNIDFNPQLSSRSKRPSFLSAHRRDSSHSDAADTPLSAQPPSSHSFELRSFRAVNSVREEGSPFTPSRPVSPATSFRDDVGTGNTISVAKFREALAARSSSSLNSQDSPLRRSSSGLPSTSPPPLARPIPVRPAAGPLQSSPLDPPTRSSRSLSPLQTQMVSPLNTQTVQEKSPLTSALSSWAPSVLSDFMGLNEDSNKPPPSPSTRYNWLLPSPILNQTPTLPSSRPQSPSKDEPASSEDSCDPHTTSEDSDTYKIAIATPSTPKKERFIVPPPRPSSRNQEPVPERLASKSSWRRDPLPTPKVTPNHSRRNSVVEPIVSTDTTSAEDDDEDIPLAKLHSGMTALVSGVLASLGGSSSAPSSPSIASAPAFLSPKTAKSPPLLKTSRAASVSNDSSPVHTTTLSSLIAAELQTSAPPGVDAQLFASLPPEQQQIIIERHNEMQRLLVSFASQSQHRAQQSGKSMSEIGLSSTREEPLSRRNRQNSFYGS